MKLEILDYWCTDIENLESWIPEKQEDIFYPLQLTIGESGGESGNDFQILITSPEALKKRAITDWGTGMLIVKSPYSWLEVYKKIKLLVSSCSRNSWEKSVDKLRIYFNWEYEDYK